MASPSWRSCPWRAASPRRPRSGVAQRLPPGLLTGYVTGGISPFGQRRRLPVVLDEGARAHDTLFVSAGRRGLQVEVPPAALIDLLDARLADLVAP